nr:MAG TPA: hypothetical protein [Caudoviricetes sp.]
MSILVTQYILSSTVIYVFHLYRKLLMVLSIVTS